MSELVTGWVMTAPEAELGAGAATGAGEWFLVAAGVGLFIYAAYKCGKIIYRWSEMSRNGCGTWSETLATATLDEVEETRASVERLLQRIGLVGRENEALRYQLEASRIALATAQNEAAILRVQLQAERRAKERVEAERNELRNRLATVERGSRRMKDELVTVRQEKRTQDQRIADHEEQINYLMRCMSGLPVQETVRR